MPNLLDYQNLSAAAYFAAGSKPIAPTGYKVLTSRPMDGSGVQAVVFQNSQTKEIVIAYEGTASLLTQAIEQDGPIATGEVPSGNAVALEYAQQIVDTYSQQGVPIYVTGHSLGGEYAQYVAENLPNIAGGAAIGAPGVPTLSTPTTNNFIDYLKYSDMVANTSSDSPVGQALGLTDQYHYGTVIWLGSQADQLQLLNSVDLYKTLLTNNPEDSSGFALGFVGANGFSNHLLKYYANDFGFVPTYNTAPMTINSDMTGYEDFTFTAPTSFLEYVDPNANRQGTADPSAMSVSSNPYGALSFDPFTSYLTGGAQLGGTADFSEFPYNGALESNPYNTLDGVSTAIAVSVWGSIPIQAQTAPISLR